MFGNVSGRSRGVTSLRVTACKGKTDRERRKRRRIAFIGREEVKREIGEKERERKSWMKRSG